ncbi:MAG: NusG domain II-containing protein [Clostridia bacterium]|nr:NusG domain II-containing protein [Clostridia bacterium]
MNKTPLFRKSDIIIILVCLLTALVFFLPTLFSSDRNLTAVIVADGETVKEISLTDSTDEKIEIDGVVIKAQGRSIYFEDSDCPDRICVRSGELSSKGESAACVPNRVSVYIKGADNFDIMTY